MRLITSLDIGTSKVVALVGEVDSYGDLHVIGLGEAPSKGIDMSYVTRLYLAVSSVLNAIKEAQEMAGTKITPHLPFLLGTFYLPHWNHHHQPQRLLSL